MSDPFIRTAAAADRERCLAALAWAFSADPPCRWAWSDPQQYLEAFPRFARGFGGAAIDHGTANYREGFSGVALWLSPGVTPDEESLMNVIQDTVTHATEGRDVFDVRTNGRSSSAGTSLASTAHRSRSGAPGTGNPAQLC